MRLVASLARSVSVIGLLGGGWSGAAAQTPELQAEAAQPQDEPIAAATDQREDQAIVVTGSRLSGAGFVAPTPVTVQTNEELQTAAPSTISAGLNQLPQFRASSRPEAAQSTAGGAASANQLNLRQLGFNRNLVLLDGRRVVGSSVNYVVDINTLPEALIERVEVVTGGASAAYGSDAVAGVVNFILNDRLNGLKATIQAGISDEADAASYKANLAYGLPFADGQGHIMLSGEYYDSDGIGLGETSGRPWAQRNAALIPNVPSSARPSRLLVSDNVFLAAATAGGLITTGPLAGTQFLPGGVSAPFTFGTLRSSVFMVGGGPNALRTGVNITNDLKRWSTFGRVSYEFSEAAKFSVEGAYARADTRWNPYFNPNYASAGNQFTIFADNPYLPADITARMAAAGLTSFQLGRVFTDAKPIGALNKTTVWHVTAALKGALSDTWAYDAYYTHGESETYVENTNVENYNRIYAAVDAVRDPATGNIVCRSTLLFGRDPSCVPLNPFGSGSPSAAALDYVVGNQWRDQDITQDVVALNIQGELFNLASTRPVAVGFGVEYRKETANQTVDSESQTRVETTGVRGVPAAIVGRLGPFVVGNPKPNSGSVNVKDAYVEVNVPIVEDRPFLRLVEVNAAARLTDYSTSGNVVTWKVGANYKPIEDLRLRATRSRDIRGPNIAELFSGAVQTTGTIREPGGATVSFLGQTVGNPELEPEKADSLTIGAVYQPSFIPRLNLSIDYYDIKIEDAISALTAQLTIDECARGAQVACDNITQLPGQYLIRLPNLNLNSLHAEGVDFELLYTLPLRDGRLRFRGFANYQGKLVSQTPGSVPINRAGEVGDLRNPGSPKWIATGSVTYSNEGFTGFVQGRYLGPAKYMATFEEGVDIDENDVPSVFYVDLSLRYQIPSSSGPSVELYTTVNNLFDKEPPLVPLITGGTVLNTNGFVYDAIGRYFTAGVNLKF